MICFHLKGILTLGKTYKHQITMLFGFFQSLEEAHDRQHKCGGFYQLTSGLEKKFV